MTAARVSAREFALAPQVGNLRLYDGRGWAPPAHYSLEQVRMQEAFAAEVGRFAKAFVLHVGAFPFIVAISIHLEDQCVRLTVHTKVLAREQHLGSFSSRHAPPMVSVDFDQQAPYELLTCGVLGVAGWVHGAIRQAVQHELDECFYVDGVRMFDPHVEDKPG